MILNNVNQLLLPAHQFVGSDPGVTTRQIVLHHTAGGSAQSTYNWWNSNTERVATHFLIDRDGKAFQCIPLNRWAYHIYIGSKGNRIPDKYKRDSSIYDRMGIGIEVCSWGQLTEKDGKFFNYMNREVNAKDVCTLDTPYRGFKHYEKYTDAQLKSLENIIMQLVKIFNISLLEDYTNIFNVHTDALERKAGIFSHTSFRTDKNDMYPAPELLSMLNNLHKTNLTV